MVDVDEEAARVTTLRTGWSLGAGTEVLAVRTTSARLELAVRDAAGAAERLRLAPGASDGGASDGDVPDATEPRAP